MFFLSPGTIGAVYGEQTIHFVGEHKALFFRLFVSTLFVFLVVGVLVYHFRERFPWLFPVDHPHSDEGLPLPAGVGDTRVVMEV